MFSCIVTFVWFSNIQYNMTLGSSSNLVFMYIFLTFGLQILFGVCTGLDQSRCFPNFLIAYYFSVTDDASIVEYICSRSC